MSWPGFWRRIWAAPTTARAAAGSVTGAGGSIVFALASSVRVPTRA